MNLIEQYPAIFNGIGVFISAFLTPVFAHWGIDTEGTQQIVGAILAALSAIAGVVFIAVTHKKVTPVANPMNNEGVALIPAVPPIPDQ